MTSRSTAACGRRSEKGGPLPHPGDGILLTHFLVSRDVARAHRFFAQVLGGEAVRDDAPAIVALANSRTVSWRKRTGPGIMTLLAAGTR